MLHYRTYFKQILLYRSVTGWGCDYSPHRRAFVRLPVQEVREHIMSKWEVQQRVRSSECGHHDGKKSLDIRDWTCPTCYTHHDRYVNASKNILTEGLRIVALA
ncbi:zinc ribbon domain-containing protein [Amphibacillus sediminis]|uniref:zinc ribbon domain-containing protein n=1 Tax=Amphibacillus sediminis TaxID=360185 RepID=UPI00357176C2